MWVVGYGFRLATQMLMRFSIGVFDNAWFVGRTLESTPLFRRLPFLKRKREPPLLRKSAAAGMETTTSGRMDYRRLVGAAFGQTVDNLCVLVIR